MIRQPKELGFTAVELLITLFVAAAFLIAGYQLFNVVIRDGGQARAESSAANVAYDYMRRYAPQAPNPCTSSPALTDAPITVEGLTNAKISIAFSCPAGMATTGLSKIEATIKYNIPEQTLTYSTFTNGISGAVSTDIVNGLVGWWKFNGNANATTGENAINSGASLTTSPNGNPNSAFSFDGVDDAMTIPTASFIPDTNFTLSFWARPANGSSNLVVIGSYPDIQTNRLSVYFPWANGIYWDFGSDTTRASTAWNAGWTNQWALWTFTATPSGRAIYRNGTQITASASATSFNNALVTGIYFGRNSAGTYWSGSLDDIRMYSRVLSPTEITTLYTNGAK